MLATTDDGAALSGTCAGFAGSHREPWQLSGRSEFIDLPDCRLVA
jgi:hypothetical protein